MVTEKKINHFCNHLKYALHRIMWCVLICIMAIQRWSSLSIERSRTCCWIWNDVYNIIFWRIEINYIRKVHGRSWVTCKTVNTRYDVFILFISLSLSLSLSLSPSLSLCRQYRSRDAASRGDKYMLVSFDEPSMAVKVRVLFLHQMR